MELSVTQVPLWVSLSFGITFTTIPPILIANAAKKALGKENPSNRSNLKRNIVSFYTIFFVVIGVLSWFGAFSVNALPPHIVTFAALPLFLFYILIVQRKAWFQSVYEEIRTEQLVQIHIFRFVGIYFFLVNAYGTLPDTFALVGGAGDIVTAVLAIPTVYLLKRKARFAKAMAWGWNIIGLVDIITVLTTAILITRQAMVGHDPGVQQFGTFPFSWIPAFAPATIIFLHILIFKKLVSSKSL
ncbi:MAG: hypothetical protein AAGB24_13255 [Bacteroidota bacterium]